MLEKKGYIIPFAKMRGTSSFSSLSVAKKLLGTNKVGHTGTLDSFADGLLVLLSGKLTRIARFIEAQKKRYEALIVFGLHKDTLDVFGKVIMKASLPKASQIQKVIEGFEGYYMQEPPQFSALHVGGRRASDVARQGGMLLLAPRKVHIERIIIKGISFNKNLDMLEWNDYLVRKDDYVSALHIEVLCSKGTYIRALARDIAFSLGTLGYVRALRRLSIGAFNLENAFGFSSLPPFLSSELKVVGEYKDALKDYAQPLSKRLCASLGLFILEIKEDFVQCFLQGKEIKRKWFFNTEDENNCLLDASTAFVFFLEEALGVIEFNNKVFRYKFVL